MCPLPLAIMELTMERLYRLKTAPHDSLFILFIYLYGLFDNLKPFDKISVENNCVLEL